MSSSASQSPFGAPVTLSATVLAGKRKAGQAHGDGHLQGGEHRPRRRPGSIRKRIGTAYFSTSALAPGNHAIVATYSGDKRLAASSNATPVALLVPRVSTALTLTSPDTSPFGEQVTLTAKVAPSVPNPGPPTGTVTFTEGGTVLGTAPLQVVNGVAQAALMTSSLSTGSHTIVATYSSDGNSNSSNNDSASRSLRVVPAATTLEVTGPKISSSNNTVQYSFTATVKPSSGSPPILPTGTVNFYPDAHPELVTLESLQVVNGVAQATYTFTPDVGTHKVYAIYAGHDNFVTSHT